MLVFRNAVLKYWKAYLILLERIGILHVSTLTCHVQLPPILVADNGLILSDKSLNIYRTCKGLRLNNSKWTILLWDNAFYLTEIAPFHCTCTLTNKKKLIKIPCSADGQTKLISDHWMWKKSQFFVFFFVFFFFF